MTRTSLFLGAAKVESYRLRLADPGAGGRALLLRMTEGRLERRIAVGARALLDVVPRGLGSVQGNGRTVSSIRATDE